MRFPKIRGALLWGPNDGDCRYRYTGSPPFTEICFEDEALGVDDNPYREPYDLSESL